MKADESKKMIKYAEKYKKKEAAFGISLFLSLLIAAASLFFYNLDLLRLSPMERGTAEVVQNFQEERVMLSGSYVDKLAFQIEGSFSIKPDQESGWIQFPAGTHSLDLLAKLTYKDGTEASFLLDRNPAYVTTQYVPVSGNPVFFQVEPVIPGGYGELSGAVSEAEAAAIREETNEAEAGRAAEAAAQAGASQAGGSREGVTAAFPQYDFSGLRFTDLRVVNELRLNPYLAFFAFAASFCLLLLFFFRDFFSGKPEWALLLILLTLGTAMTVSLPRNKVGYDEETHLQAVMDIASFPGQLHIADPVMNALIVTDLNNPVYQPGTLEETEDFDAYLRRYGDYKAGNNTPDFYTMPNRIPSYLSMAAMVKLGKGLSLSWPFLLTLGRLGNLLLYALLMFFAVRITPVGKLLLLVIALFPQNVFLASTFSYDPFVTGCLMLAFALFLRELWKGPSEKADLRSRGLMLLFFFFGCLSKAVYAPLVLTALLLSGTGLRGKKERYAYRLFVILVFCLLIISFILPTVFAPKATGDLRGGATSEISQVGFILQNPLSYALILLSQMIRWIPQCFFGADVTSFMGHLVNGDTKFHGLYIGCTLLLALAVLLEGRGQGQKPEQKPEQKLEQKPEPRSFNVLERLWIFLMIGACSVLIWTSMYVAFTEPGAREIAGVQGRYFIPLLYPLYLLFAVRAGKRTKGALAEGGKGPILATHLDLWYYFTESAAAGILLVTVFAAVLSRFCM